MTAHLFVGITTCANGSCMLNVTKTGEKQQLVKSLISLGHTRRMTAQKNKHGILAIKELENILDTCKVELTQVDEVWPNLYIGNV